MLQPLQKFCGWSFAQAAEVGNGTAVSGKVTVGLFPGSTFVLNRSTGHFQTCTNDTCPYAVNVTLVRAHLSPVLSWVRGVLWLAQLLAQSHAGSCTSAMCADVLPMSRWCAPVTTCNSNLRN